MAETSASPRAKSLKLPYYAFVELAKVVDYHPAVREMLEGKPAEYSPDLAAICPKVLVDLAQTHPLGVVPVPGQEDRFHCIAGIRLYRRLRALKVWNHPVPVLIFAKMPSKKILALAEGDYYFAPHLAGPPATARYAHASVWAKAQSTSQLSAKPSLTGEAILATVLDIDERGLHGKAQAHLRNSE
jgi:hypothetical protein